MPPTRSNSQGFENRACKECHRLKIKCTRVFPCQNCVRRGCQSICPEATLVNSFGNRLISAETEPLHTQLQQLSLKVRDLEESLRLAQTRVSGNPHPLLSPERLREKLSEHVYTMSDPLGKDAVKPRAHGAPRLACNECRRLKLKCSRVFPCDGCVKRGCPDLCPEGKLTGGRKRMVVADAQTLHLQIMNLTARAQNLQAAIDTITPTSSTTTTPPQSRPEQMSIRHLLFSDNSSSPSPEPTISIPVEIPVSHMTHNEEAGETHLPVDVEYAGVVDTPRIPVSSYPSGQEYGRSRPKHSLLDLLN